MFKKTHDLKMNALIADLIFLNNEKTKRKQNVSAEHRKIIWRKCSKTSVSPLLFLVGGAGPYHAQANRLSPKSAVHGSIEFNIS